MKMKLKILKPFFENPNEEFQIRELSRLLNINHTTIRQYLLKLVEEEVIEIKKGKPYDYFKATINKKFLNLKLFFNLEKLRKSKLIEEIEKDYDYPTIILFGSYASATDDCKSDIDLFLLTEIKKEKDYSKFKNKLNREITLHIFSKSGFNLAKNKNPELLNNILNGITLSGKLEVFQ
ncbi:MAG TPA: nucleotidyltransferase domain-containing protein [Candidatus Pacearchaeota archaeon]|jgi:predicted nucleotidyltransferase|nr:nucleotidyltransferase domain-containing protein [Candidatus Pacearchaeota archaeon]HOF44536.1 nucleotidyltransferase domain-containing protein [Candidatus Pacearchaeota archaeon]HOU79512.1 nucleotidyltransferase domain-containing protein [Candidatus Pacearchaeota archaeon]HPJ86964.1 nucleotidyltransferase domain-containing protein [Candidatus Pacearchaeota archaeon]HQI57984.1 nucleotidyltransferase domain-containing protein [Candidatus Pacearchaeota archaeon]